MPAPTPMSVSLDEAVGRVLAKDVCARFPIPSFDNSAVDGFAVRHDEVVGESSVRPAELTVHAIAPAGTDTRLGDLPPRSAVQIMTGAPLPPALDTVIPVEWTTGFVIGLGQPVRITAHPECGANIRRRGEDLSEGAVALRAGDVLYPARTAVLAALGATSASVYRPLRVAVMSTGTELTEQSKQLHHGQIYESNGVMLSAAIRAAGASAERVPFVSDDIRLFRDALAEYSQSVDLIVTTGGISAGTHEVVKSALSQEDVSFMQVAIKPGRPQGIGHYRGTPIVCFPGNPVSAYTSFEVFLRPQLRRVMGYRATTRQVVRACLGSAIPKRGQADQYRLGTYEDGVADPVSTGASHSIRALGAANCLIILPVGVEGAEGDVVEVWLLDGPH
ncbi:molybdopterin molybdotransferase MoeA [Rhodococcus sp. T2V]|uniref:molybdopterin molybdotransferase MoeA n=1 Tax=Rhodococcus sp. T2V TaxID=3034164 RepID=UPI0023E2A0B9|nr:gephyrin-like molybdotransferase Glp [Rhodococcus sp. T2V]MDF3311013.1 molybdopterin molybdotransferase MoeA [Rhodococcus sp. T2V]